MTEQELVRFSKTISYALRHDPASFGLVLADDGSVPVSELLVGISKARHRTYTEADLDAVFAMPGKKRFIIEDGRIRAYYGHTVEQDIIRAEIEPPEVLYHATSHKALPMILEGGLQPMNRQHVHLASTKGTALDAGRRRDADPPLLLIRAHDAWKAGIRFYQGNEDICMSDPIPAKYIRECI